jgi:hypothetical protein
VADLRAAIIGYGLAGRVFHAPLFQNRRWDSDQLLDLGSHLVDQSFVLLFLALSHGNGVISHLRGSCERVTTGWRSPATPKNA